MEIKQNESDAAERMMLFPLVVDATDGLTVEVGEAGGQPQYTIDGGQNWVNTNGVLVGGTNGAYQVQLTQAEVNQTYGITMLGRYKSAATAEARSIPIRIVAPDPFSATNMGLSNLDGTVTSRAPAATALSDVTWTAAKAAFLDAAVSTRGTADPGDAMDLIGDAVDAAALAASALVEIADIVFEDITGNRVTANTFGRLIRDNVDTQISTRSVFDPTIDEVMLIDGAITAAKIAAAAFIAAKFGAGAIDANALATSAANEIRDAILDDATRFSGADIDAAISSRSSHDANAVRDAILDDATRFSGADIDAAISSRGTADPGDAMDLIANAVDAAALALSAINEIRDGILDDATRFSGADIDAAISSRSTLTAAQVDVVLAAAHGAGSWLTGAGGDATAANQVTILADIAGQNDPSVVDIDTQLTSSHGAGSWAAALGVGAKAVTIKVVDGAANDVVGVSVTVKNDPQTADIGTSTTDSVGETAQAFGLEPVTDYKAVIASNVNYVFSNPYSFTTAVGVGAETITLVCAVRSFPVPSADKYLLVMNCADEEADLVGAADWTVRVIEMRPVGLGADDLVTLTEERPFTTDADGLITWEVAKITRRLTIEITRTMHDGTTQKHEETFLIDGSKAVADVIDVADLLTD